MRLLGTDLTRDIQRDMFDYVPKEYEDYRESNAIVVTEATELELLNERIADVLAQLYVETATWGLAEWERLVGLNPNPSYSDWNALDKLSVNFESVEGKTWDDFEKAFVPNMAERRSAIKSKLRGYGTITKQKLAEICDAYTGGAVEVREYPAEYRVVIEFVDTVGLPSNIDTLQMVVGEMMPAHLLVEYQFRYLRWDEFDNRAWTWDALDMELLTWDELAEAVI